MEKMCIYNLQEDKIAPRMYSSTLAFSHSSLRRGVVVWVGSACTSACVVKGGLELVLMFVLLSLHWKHKFEIDRNTLFELTLILHVSFNLRTIQYMGEAKIIL